MDNLESCIDKLLNSKPVYNEPMPPLNPPKRLNKKMIAEEEEQRKQAISDFGYNQNSMNIDFIRAFLELQKYCKRLEQTVEKESSEFQKAASAISILKRELDSVRLRSTLNSNQIEKMDAGLYKYTEKLEDYALVISPGARTADCPKGCVETDLSDAIGYYDRIENAKKSSDMKELEKFCNATMSKNLSSLNAFEEVVIDFSGGDKYAAIIFGNLVKNSIYKVKLLKDQDIPSGRFSVICTETAFVPRKLMLKSAVVVVTGDDPFKDVDEDYIKNLKFLNDSGLHTYITVMESAYREFESKGFRCVKRIAADKLLNAEVVRIVEKSMDSSVPSGAVSYSTFMDMFDGLNNIYLTENDEIEEYLNTRIESYPYNCLNVMEKSAEASIKNKYFPTGTAESCHIKDNPEGKFGFVDGMNYVNHLDYEGRKRIYSQVKKIMEPDGIFMINCSDAVVGIKVRALKGWSCFPLYEAMWTREQIIEELERNGFRIKFLIPTGAGLFDSLPAKYKKSPVEWIIGATL